MRDSRECETEDLYLFMGITSLSTQPNMENWNLHFQSSGVCYFLKLSDIRDWFVTQTGFNQQLYLLTILSNIMYHSSDFSTVPCILRELLSFMAVPGGMSYNF